ncbi:redox-sensing transcriptional repressor Rex [Desulfallas thermosapovorans]|uniref:Redox-sensing transcriptional repressor Rex n=1 Tax=Desulfallas thermosapovorans DSM 6562 TaxID=1121431 RepID=A0A5S4ZQL8_9FIRM|nr:redox-sensing transcriptional repressor Rex [Desulfallas thermosapovorans]TYO94999.1 redox-sensing transcriptional repressor [Desulfallas thermosapovorans DSM 6562]
MKTLRVPEATVTRLSIYSRFLERLDRNGITTVSSGEIAEGVGVSPAQVRKDLAYFGEFGTRGVGYNVKDLLKYTLKILGLDQEWALAIVGAGNLGFALCTYRGFNVRGFNIVGVFDKDTERIGKRIGNLVVQPLTQFPETAQKENIRIGVIAVPTSAAQEVADMMVKNGVQAILNFAPVGLNVPDEIEIRNVDLSVKLEVLTFNLGFRAAQSL